MSEADEEGFEEDVTLRKRGLALLCSEKREHSDVEQLVGEQKSMLSHQ
jgi:hypothetical protein